MHHPLEPGLPSFLPLIAGSIIIIIILQTSIYSESGGPLHILHSWIYKLVLSLSNGPKKEVV